MLFMQLDTCRIRGIWLCMATCVVPFYRLANLRRMQGCERLEALSQIAQDLVHGLLLRVCLQQVSTQIRPAELTLDILQDYIALASRH
jgi:hypothetical protein